MTHKILLVDDDKINTALVKFGLAEKRYDVEVAYDGDEGLVKAKEFAPDLIILDIYMPNLNGFEFLTELKNIQDFKMPHVIVLTSNETMEDVFKLEGVSSYFVKPVEIHDLVLKIVELLGENNY